MHERFHAALARRQPLLDGATDAVRLIDGEGDGLPGLYLEAFADRWLVSTQAGYLAEDARSWLAASGRSVYWKRLDQQQKDSPAHLCGPHQDEPFTMQENGLAYEISLQAGYSQGIFLDQRDNRRRVSALATASVLNTFAYTGGFSVCAASSGAATTTLDLSQVYLDWARRNLALNGIDTTTQHFCKGDTFHWLRRFAKQGRRFGGIILDPPTFSRDDKGKVFRVEKDYAELVALAVACLEQDGWMLCCTNCRKLPGYEFEMMVREGAQRPVDIEDAPMPADFTAEPYLKSLWLRI
jgi:23S rRNA (cytosine1962-C5)-methyltransferase